MARFFQHRAPGLECLLLCEKNFSHIYLTWKIFGCACNGHKVLILLATHGSEQLPQFHFSKIQAKLSYAITKANMEVNECPSPCLLHCLTL